MGKNKTTVESRHFTGEWDAGMLFAVRGHHNTPTRTAVFYWGTQVTHGDYPLIYAYPNATNGIGRATMRRDGWFSFDADGSDAQTLLTAPITLPNEPSTLVLNMLTTVRGYVKAELQDADTGAPVPGFALADSVYEHFETRYWPLYAPCSVVLRVTLAASVCFDGG